MKKLFTLIPFLCISAFVFCQTQYDLGQVTWHKHEATVLLPGEKGTWDAEGVLSPSVLKIDDTYHMWYSGIGEDHVRIGHATSEDGLVWVKDENNPVIDVGEPGSFDDTRAYLPTVAYDGTTFHLYYVTDKSVNGEQMGYATSEDGVSWSKHTGEPVFQSENGNLMSRSIHKGDVYHYGDKFHMWAGTGDLDYCDINYFTSPDGITWTAYENNPVLENPPPGEWDAPRTQVSTVFELGGEFHMWYCGGTFSNWQIGYASSTDGLSWTRAENNPVLPVGEPGEWDEKSTHFPTVMAQPVDDNYKLIMWYGGSSNEGFGGIGYAESDQFEIVGISGIKDRGKLKIYPVPARNLINIQTSIRGEKQIHIISISGKTVYQGILTDDENQVDISSLQKGIYFAKMNSGERVLTGKVVVQ